MDPPSLLLYLLLLYAYSSTLINAGPIGVFVVTYETSIYFLEFVL